MPPYQTGGGMVLSVNFRETTFAGLPFKFEAGTPNISGAVSLGAAIDYIESIGISRIQAWESELVKYAFDRMSSIDGIILYGPSENRCGLISFNLDNTGPYDTAVMLDKLGIAVRSGTHCAEPVMKRFGVRGTVRASFALYNTADEVDALVEGIKRIRKIIG